MALWLPLTDPEPMICSYEIELTIESLPALSAMYQALFTSLPCGMQKKRAILCYIDWNILVKNILMYYLV